MASQDLEQYRTLVEHAPAMIWRSGPDARRDYFNATWLAFTGRALAQEAGSGWTGGIFPDDRDRYLAAYGEHHERRRPLELDYRLRRCDGVYRHVFERAAPFDGAAGEFAGFIGSCADVDDRRAARAVAADDFFELSLDNVCVAGFDGYFKRVNPSWTRTLGWTAEELLSKPLVEFVHPEDRAATLASRRRLMAGLEMGPHVNRYLCKDGTYRWFEWRSVAAVERGLVYAVARDITPQKEAEEHLRESTIAQERLQRQLVFADRMASVGTLAAGAAHEINNPLTYVSGNLDLILAELGGAGDGLAPQRAVEIRAMAAEAKAGAERIRKIVNGLKTFSRVEEERRGVIEVEPLLDLSVDMTFNEIRHRARLVKDYGKIPPVLADEARLGQVFINLLVNAAQAIPDGDSAGNEIRIVTSTDAAGRAVVEVRDTGPGIEQGFADRIFDPFFTTKPIGVGTGLGLSICHTIVSAMGGEISAVAREGRGAIFRVVLPAAEPTPSETAAAVAAGRAVARASVLVVDDEAAIGAVLRRVLGDHEVTAVTTARQALELLEAGRHFDVVLSDLMMPEMSGMDLHDELTRRFPEVAERVVFVSGGAFTPSARAFLDRVPNERIDKPFDPQQVRDLVERCVAARAAGVGQEGRPRA